MTRLTEPLNDEEKVALVAAARSFIGVPFRHQGRTINGMDCIGHLVLSFAAINKPLRNRVDYGRLPANAKLEAALSLHFGPPVAGPPQPADVVVLAWEDDPRYVGLPCHVGIVAPHPEPRIGISLIHCYAISGRVIEHGFSADWLSRVVGVYR